VGTQIRVLTGGDDGMNGNNGNDGNDGKRKELRVFIVSGERQKQVSRWIFLERLRFCFKIADGNYQSVPYDKGMEICRRIVTKAIKSEKSESSTIKVVGSMVEELQKEGMVSELFKEGKIVLGGVQ